MIRVISRDREFSIDLPDDWQRSWPAELESDHGFCFAEPVTGVALQFRPLGIPVAPTREQLMWALTDALGFGGPPRDVAFSRDADVGRIAATFDDGHGYVVRQWLVTNGRDGIDAAAAARPDALRAAIPRIDAVLATVRCSV